MVYSAALVKVFAAALLATTAVNGLQLNAVEVAQRDHVVSSRHQSLGATEEPELIVLSQGSPAARAVGAYAQGQDVRRDDVFVSIFMHLACCGYSSTHMNKH